MPRQCRSTSRTTSTAAPADHTVSFVLDGKVYEIDLSEAHTEKLCDALQPFVAAGRKTTRNGTRTTSSRSTGTRAAGTDPDTAKMHAWAKADGHPVFARGRIHQSVKNAYYATQN